MPGTPGPPGDRRSFGWPFLEGTSGSAAVCGEGRAWTVPQNKCVCRETAPEASSLGRTWACWPSGSAACCVWNTGACPWQAPPTGRSSICGPRVGPVVPGAAAQNRSKSTSQRLCGGIAPTPAEPRALPPLQLPRNALASECRRLTRSRGPRPARGALLPAVTSSHTPVWERLGLRASSTPPGGGPHGSARETCAEERGPHTLSGCWASCQHPVTSGPRSHTCCPVHAGVPLAWKPLERDVGV